MREKYESLSVTALRDLARARKIKYASSMKKSELVEAMLLQDEKDQQAAREERTEAAPRQRRTPEKAAASERRDASGNARTRSERTAQERSDRSGQERSGQERSERSGQERSERSTQERSERSTQERSERTTQERSDRSGQERGERSTQERSARTNQERGGDRTARRSEERAGRRTDDSRAKRGEERTGDYTARRTASGRRPARPARSDNSGSDPAQASPVESAGLASGILEVMADGYGFLRSDNYLPGENDVYVAPSQIRKFGLKTGDIVTGQIRAHAQQEKYNALLYVQSINGFDPAEAVNRYNFEDMTPVFPDERIRLERTPRDIAMRIVDLISPIGKGQRGMIVSPPKAGKTTLLKDIARSVLANCPQMHIIIMLIDERPEEVTDIREAIVGSNVEVLYSTFDEMPEHHKRVSEMGIERAKRLVEHGEDVIILLDSITRLARAYNLTVSPSGRTLSGGLDPAALYMPKRFFGAARNMREGGSLTILATALVDTGSKMDDVVYEEFKGTGNMELVLDRKLSEKRVFPAIDIQKSGTRREDLLLDAAEMEAVLIMRRELNGQKSEEAVENILNRFVHTRSNQELVDFARRMRYI